MQLEKSFEKAEIVSDFFRREGKNPTFIVPYFRHAVKEMCVNFVKKRTSPKNIQKNS